MEEFIKDQQLINEHLANERTFLAWIRTGIGIMAFGFVVVKFSVFIVQMGNLSEKIIATKNLWSQAIGIALVVAGGCIIACSYFKYRRAAEMMRKGVYQYSTFFLTAIATILFIISILMMGYLVILTEGSVSMFQERGVLGLEIQDRTRGT